MIDLIAYLYCGALLLIYCGALLLIHCRALLFEDGLVSDLAFLKRIKKK